MNHKSISKKTIITLVAIFTFISLFAATEIADSTVVAVYKGGTITMGDLNERLSQIPPMYKSKFTTIEGKIELLDMICIEEVFYLEALTHKVMEQKEFTERIADQIKSAYFSEYRKELLKNGVSITIEEKKAYFTENHDQYKEQTFEEAEKLIESRLKPEKEKELIETKKEELFGKFNVKINYDLLAKINIAAPDSNEVIINENIISSSNSKINRTVGDIIAYIDILPKRTQMSLHSEAGLKRYIDELAKSDVFYVDALANGFDKNPILITIINQIKRNMALRTIYNTLVVEAIDTSDEAVEKYYNDNIDQFSTLAYRKIQTFGFDTKKIATKMRKTVKKLIKKQKDEEINTLIAENSVYPAKDGDKLVGLAVKSYTNSGFSGLIVVMVGFTPDGTVYNYQVLDHKETPGLGSKMEDWFRPAVSEGNAVKKASFADWLFGIKPSAGGDNNSIINKNPSKTKFTVSKDGGDIDAITAATISSRAFLDAIDRGYKAWDKATKEMLTTNAEGGK